MAFLGIGKKKKNTAPSQTERAVDTLGDASANDRFVEGQLADFGQQLGSDTQGQGYQGDEFNAYYDYNVPAGNQGARTRAESIDDRRQIDSWNSRMDEAYAAAGRGDMETANRLRSEVEAEHATYAGRAGESALDAGIARNDAANEDWRTTRGDLRAQRDADLAALGERGRGGRDHSGPLGKQREHSDAYQEARGGIKDQYREDLRGPRDLLRSESREARDMEARGTGKIGGITVSTRDRNASAKELSSPMSMTIGGLVRDARALQDPNSETSRRFKDSLTAGALAQIDAAQLNAERGLATGERTAARGARDQRLAYGGQAGTAAAMAARTSERFAALNASNETQSGAARAAVHGEAAKTYESFRREFAVSSVQAAQSYMSNMPKFRDAYRTSQLAMSQSAASVLSKVGLQTLIGQQAAAADRRSQTSALVGGAFGVIAGAASAISPVVGAAITGVGALANWATDNT